ncbi:LytTR family DNA-binding domain-containing protein [Microbulbifer variabilis]|uniref:LytR/AlgR family response regulator transcription factor n=1 Tax=Microbulbifer variabilis TaxID=266805 RepID=UPI001CFC6B6B
MRKFLRQSTGRLSRLAPHHQLIVQVQLSDGNQQRIISHDHINYIESIGRYRRVHLTEKGARLHNTDTIISDMTLDTFCEQLPSKVFYRLHRSYIINSERLLELKSQSRRHFVRMAGTDIKIPVSRNFLNRLKRSIKTSC